MTLDKSPKVNKFFIKIRLFLLNIFYNIKNTLINDKDDTSDLKKSLFIGFSLFTVIACGPLLLFGSFMFLVFEKYLFATLEALVLAFLVFFILYKKKSIQTRILHIIVLLYTMSIFILLTTSNNGAGMVCVVVMMFVSGIVLERKRLIYFLSFNIVVFAVITILLSRGVFDGTVMEVYKNIWFINMLTAQVCGIGLMFLIHIIYQTLDKRNVSLRESENLLKESENKKSLLLANINGMVYRCRIDDKWTMEYISEGCLELTGYNPKQLLGNKEISYNELILDAFRDEVRREWEISLDKLTDYKGEYLILTAENQQKWVYEQGHGIRDENGKLVALEGLIIDITERKKKEDEILYLNQYDVLTGVHNRRWIERNKDSILIEKNMPISIMVGDINGLKLINDALGHLAGDRHIQAAANIIKKCCRKNDIIARMGGDEFLTIMPNTETDEAADILSNIQSECSAKNKEIDEEKYYLSLSLGYATRRDKEQTIEEVVKIAEDYMYRRKLLENKSVHSSLISSIQTTMDEKSHETEEHSKRLADLAQKIGVAFKLPQVVLDEIELLAMLHDVGKIGIDDSILNKPGKLTEEEWVQMKRHPEIGYRIAISSPELSSIADLILSHHERWDGTGYPRGLKGDEIPIQSRIIAIADSYDAMTNDRPYRKKLSKEKAINEIERNSQKQFDPILVEIFKQVILN